MELDHESESVVPQLDVALRSDLDVSGEATDTALI